MLSGSCIARSTATIACVAAGFLSGSHADAEVIAGPFTNPANGNQYSLLDAKGWPESEAEAQLLGGHLVTLDDAAEAEWVTDTFFALASGQGNLWIGLNDADVEGLFVWASGDPVEYVDWADGQPDNLNGTEHFVHIFGPGRPESPTWNDFNAAGEAPTLTVPHGVVEVPTTTSAPADRREAGLSAFPNPFNPRTSIEFQDAVGRSGSLVVYSLRGERVAILHEGTFTRSRFVWRGVDDSGAAVASGTFLVVGIADGRIESTKVTLVR